MSQPWLLLDVSGLAYRAMHSTGDLSFEGIETGAVYGLFRSVMDLQDLFATNRVVFCFDGGYAKRLEVSRSYKQNRHKDDDVEMQEVRISMRKQLKRLRTEYLPDIGFKNVFWQKGYEADDVIASCCHYMPQGERAIIVSSDEDLWQLLVDDRVSMYSPASKKSMTAQLFRREYGIDPFLWSDVKAIAGCPGDNVIGVQGVGPKTAAKFLAGQLKSTTKKHQDIVLHTDRWNRNIKLVRLPFEGTEKFEMQDDELFDERWQKVMDSLGMKTLRDRRPKREGFFR